MSVEDGEPGRSGLGRKIEVIGHRGAAAYHPGNSRAAMEAALAIGVDRLECDVRRSSDGDLVLVHDDAVALGNSRKRPVSKATMAELRGLLPELLTLDDLVELVGGRTPLLIDVKRLGYEVELVSAIQRHGLERSSSVSCTSVWTLHRIHAALPKMRIGLSTGQWATGPRTPLGRLAVRSALRLLLPLPLMGVISAIGASEVMLQHSIATEPLVRLMHATGRRVNVWTVDHPRSIRRAVALGVDGIISNRPDEVRRILAEVDGT